MNSTIKWIIATAGWIVLLIIFGIWKSLDKEIGTSAVMGGLRGAILGGGIFFLYQWERNDIEKHPKLPNNIKNEKSKQEKSNNLSHLYEIVAEEIKNKDFKSAVLAQAIAEGNGDKEKSQAIYIRLRVSELDKQFRQNRQENSLNKLKNSAKSNLILNNIGKYIYGLILALLIFSIASTFIIFLGGPISINSFFQLLPLIFTIPLSIFVYRKYKENSILSRKPTPGTHVACPDCRELVLKNARVCKHCGCKLIPQ